MTVRLVSLGAHLHLQTGTGRGSSPHGDLPSQHPPWFQTQQTRRMISSTKQNKNLPGTGDQGQAQVPTEQGQVPESSASRPSSISGFYCQSVPPNYPLLRPSFYNTELVSQREFLSKTIRHFFHRRLCSGPVCVCWVAQLLLHLRVQGWAVACHRDGLGSAPPRRSGRQKPAEQMAKAQNNLNM